MLYLSGNGLAGFLTHLPFASLSFRSLEGSTGSSGGSLAIAALCARDTIGMEKCLQSMHPPAHGLDVLRLQGAQHHRRLRRDVRQMGRFVPPSLVPRPRVQLHDEETHHV
jgi:hypothetical protein